MPEGDTIFRTASRLRAVLEGRRLAGAESRHPRLRAASLAGSTVAAVEPRGKHLLIHFQDGRVLHSHMGMTGSWHVYAAGQAWAKPASRAAIVLRVQDAACVCFSPKTIEMLSPAELRRHGQLNHLGPDILCEDVEEGEILRRFRLHDAAPIGEALMNQTLVCGIGNIYKSETLFVCRINPFVRVGQISDGELRQLLLSARDLMRRNLLGYPRRTRRAPDGRPVWVYGRRGEACLVCGEQIRMRRQGDLGRSTYWCPACQPERRQEGCTSW